MIFNKRMQRHFILLCMMISGFCDFFAHPSIFFWKTIRKGGGAENQKRPLNFGLYADRLVVYGRVCPHGCWGFYVLVCVLPPAFLLSVRSVFCFPAWLGCSELWVPGTLSTRNFECPERYFFFRRFIIQGPVSYNNIWKKRLDFENLSWKAVLI